MLHTELLSNFELLERTFWIRNNSLVLDLVVAHILQTVFTCFLKLQKSALNVEEIIAKIGSIEYMLNFKICLRKILMWLEVEMLTGSGTQFT